LHDSCVAIKQRLREVLRGEPQRLA